MRTKGDALKVVHNVKLHPMGNYIYIGWDGFNGRHDYLMVKDFDDLDLLITELVQAMQNYKLKQTISHKTNKIKIKV